MAKKLQVIPLGGLGEFGMHMMALRYGDDILVIDSGMMFPEDELLGVDLVMPDLTFLKENQELRGLINSGYARAGQIFRNVPVGDDFEPRGFSTFAAVAIASIGRLPDCMIW